jgi:glycosyltransferase involved in cell wall biosynthesis
MARIVILGTAHPLRGGLASYNERLALQLKQENHDVVIFTFSLQYPAFLFPGKTQFSDSPAPPGLDIRICVNSINPFNWYAVAKAIRKYNPDILITKYWLPFMAPCLGSICRLVKKNKHTKIICILDNLIPHEKRIGDYALTRYFMKQVDACIAQSASVLQDINQFSPTIPRKLNPHPIFDNYGEKVSREDALQYLKLDTNIHYLLFFGFIRDYKGLDILLRSMALIKKELPHVRLIIAGEFYANSEYYLSLIKNLELENQVVLKTNYISDEEVRYYFCAADMVVQPYKHATQSGVTQICYHFEKPMLVTRVGGLPEIVPDGIVGYVTDVDEKAVAAAILDFYQQHREAEFSKNIKSEKLKYSWSQMVQSIFEMANKIAR